jgi:hypothetical protein
MDEWLAGFVRFEEVTAAAPAKAAVVPAAAAPTQRSPKTAKGAGTLLHSSGASPKRGKPKVLAPLLSGGTGAAQRRATGGAKARGGKAVGKGAKPRRAAPRGKAGARGGKAGTGKLKKAAKAAKAAKAPEVKQLSPEDRAAMSLQCAMRQRLARGEAQTRRAKIAEWEAEMVRVEAEAARMLMEMEIAEYRREQEKIKAERKREQDRKAARKAMLESAFDGEDEQIVKILTNQLIVVQVDDCDENGNTALSEAAGGGHVDTCAMLMKRGADPNVQGQFKRTPLWRATFGNHAETAKVLIEGGADYRLSDRTAMSSLLLAKSHNFPQLVSLYEDWDLGKTEKLKADLQVRVEAAQAQKRADALSKKEGARDVVRKLEKESLEAGRRLRNARCVLERRITEYDTEKAGLAGLVVPLTDNEEVHLKGIQEAENAVESLEAEAKTKKEKLDQARFELRESERVIAAEDGEEDEETAALPGIRVPLKQLADVLMTDVGGKIRDDGRVVLVVDPGRQANTFLRYRDCNYLNYCSSRDMEANSVRLALLGAIRYGKALVIDIADVSVDLDDDLGVQLDTVEQGLFRSLLSGMREYISKQQYISLIKPEERANASQEYHPSNFQPMRTDRAMVIILTAQYATDLPLDWFTVMNPIHMVVEQR